MRKLASMLTAALAVALLAVAAGAQERAQLAGGRVSFVPPEGLRLMTREEMLSKFGLKGAAEVPEILYSNEGQSVTVAVGISGQNVTADKLPDVKRLWESDFERRAPGLEWRTRDIVEMNGVRWIHLSTKVPAGTTHVIVDVYVTIFDRRLLIFTFNSNVALYDAHKESLEKSARSITVKQ